MKKFLHILIFTLIFALMLCISISAETWTDTDGRAWLFTKNDTDHTATITGANLKTGEKRTSELNIPAKVYVGETEYTVTKIGKEAFKCGTSYSSGDTYLAKKYFGHVTFPDTLVEIGERAFECSAIYGEIVIPDSVKEIGNYAFRGCVGLDTVKYTAGMNKVPVGCFQECKALVKFEAGEIEIKDENGEVVKTEKKPITEYLSSAFSNCEALLYIEISPEVTKIEGSAFSNCYCLSGELNLPKLTSLGGNAFQNCRFVEKVYLGKDCNFVLSAFSGCSKLKAYEISEENANYSTVDGVVFNKDKTNLIAYPYGKLITKYVIPESVTTVKDSAFEGASILETIIISKNVTTIETDAFRSTGITSIYFPKNVTTVGNTVIYNCNNLVWAVCEENITYFYKDMVSNTDNLIGVFSTRTKTDGITNNGSWPSKFSINLQRDCVLQYGSHFYGYLDTPAECEDEGKLVCCLCDQEVVLEPLGHVGQILRVTELDCVTNESIIVDCINCNTEQEIVSKYALGHKLGTPVSEATDKYSHSSATCSVCGEVCLNSFEISAYKGGDVNGDGTIDEKDIALLGKIVGNVPSNANLFACDVNGDGKVGTIDLLILKQYVGNLGATIADNENICDHHVHVTTVIVSREGCTNGGLYVSFCADCGAYIGEEATAPRDHMFVKTVLKEASCSVAGSLKRVCSVCDYEDTIEIEKLPHASSWWMLSDSEMDYEYSLCANCNTLEHRLVNRGVLAEIVATIPANYIKYCTAESSALLKPIVDNTKKALTQDQVDALVEEIRRVLPTIQYKVNDVPVIYLEANEKLLGKDKPYISANIVVAYYDDNGKIQTLTDSEGQMKVRGNATAGVTSKQPYNIKFSRNVDLFGMFGDNTYENTAPGKKYRLLANALDTSLIRNAVAFEFAQDLGLEYTCKYRFVEVHLNGTFKGCYMLTSPIDIGEDSVNIDEERDVIIHLSYKNGSDDAAFPSPIFGLRLMRLEEPAEYTAYTRSQMMRTMYQLDFAILSGDTDEMAKYMDMDSMMAYFIFHEYIKDMDMIWDSTRFYIEDGMLHGGPVWDLDISQGNVKVTTQRDNGFDEHSSYHYWNQEIIYGDVVTRAEIKALNDIGNFGSAIGPWADAFWVNDRGNGSSNPSLNNGQRRWWFSYMIEYSAEFRGEVALFIKENEDLFKSYYDTNLIDPITEKPVRCVIDELAQGSAATALNRNYTDGPFGAATHPNNMVYCEDDTFTDAIIYLRTWWQYRCEWLYDYYTTNFLPTEEASNAK